MNVAQISISLWTQRFRGKPQSLIDGRVGWVGCGPTVNHVCLLQLPLSFGQSCVGSMSSWNLLLELQTFRILFKTCWERYDSNLHYESKELWMGVTLTYCRGAQFSVHLPLGQIMWLCFMSYYLGAKQRALPTVMHWTEARSAVKYHSLNANKLGVSRTVITTLVYVVRST